MNEIQIFQNPEFGEIRTVTIDGEPWFVGKDVAHSLGYEKERNAVQKYVDSEDALKRGIQTNGGIQDMVVINESGLYSLIFGSKLESAKKFKRWVTGEVLPSIRKSGAYSLPESTDGKIALLAQGHMELKDEIQSVRDDLESLKMDLPILPVEADSIVAAVKKRGVDVLGGKQSKAYSDRCIRQKVYNDLYANLKHNFNCRSYKSIKRKDVEKAIEIVERYAPPLFLDDQIKEINGKGGAI